MAEEKKELHLDGVYRNRWQEFYLADGMVEDSRKKNWRDVDWAGVEKIVTHIKGKKHVREKTAGQVCFMNFRWTGRAAQFRDGEYIGHKKISLWTIGHTDGETCFLEDYDFYTGELVKTYQTPLNEFRKHVHPDIDSVVAE